MIGKELSSRLGETRDWLRILVRSAALERGNKNLGLFGGRAGNCLALMEDAVCGKNASDLAVALQAVRTLVEDLSDCEVDASLGSGLAGIGFLLNRVGELVPDSAQDFRVPLDLIDAELTKYVQTFTKHDDVDLVCGLAGIGVYGVKRYASKLGADLTMATLSRLLSFTETQGETGLTWIRAVPARRMAEIGKITDLGVAHGIPGILYFLGEATRLNLVQGYPHEYLRRSVSAFVDAAIPSDEGMTFPYVSGELLPARIGWCYGDIGISAVLHKVATILNDETLLRKSLQLAHNAFNQRAQESRAMHWSVCHGQIGFHSKRT